METVNRPVGELLSGRVVDAVPGTTLRAAARLIDEEQVGAILVEDARGTLGIITERDLVRVLGDGADPDQDRVGDHMTEDLATVDVTATVLDVLQVMRANQIRHVVVRDGEAVAGVISMRALLEALLGPVLKVPAAAR